MDDTQRFAHVHQCIKEWYGIEPPYDAELVEFVTYCLRKWEAVVQSPEREEEPHAVHREKYCEDWEELSRYIRVDRLLKIMAIEGKKHHDGHFAILSFTTGYKAGFGTPDLDSGMGRNQVLNMPAFRSLKDAIINAIVETRDFDI